jgi:hypothetical protein
MTGKQRRNICWFCGQPGASREHIVPTWIGRLLDSFLPPGARSVYHHESENPEAGIPRKYKQAGGPAFYSRKFCKPCNTVWMADLEDEVEPVLGPLILGRRAALEPAEQELLAFWATKTVLAFQSVEAAVTTWAQPAVFADLYQRQGPLSYSQVWLGAADRGEHIWSRSNSLRAADATAPDGFGAVLTVGHAVFYVAVLPAASGRLYLKPPLAQALRNIWPGSGRSMLWPPAAKATPQDLRDLAELIAQNSVMKPSTDGPT